MTRTVLTALGAFATAIVLAVTAIHPKAIASPSTVAPPALAARSVTVLPAGAQERPFDRFYRIEFYTSVGTALPYPTLCLMFTASGTWTAVHSQGLSGTYLLSGHGVFATALGNWSPQVYMSLQGIVTRKGGSGTYIVSQTNGNIFGGGTFTLLREYSSGCS